MKKVFVNTMLILLAMTICACESSPTPTPTPLVYTPPSQISAEMERQTLELMTSYADKSRSLFPDGILELDNRKDEVIEKYKRFSEYLELQLFEYVNADPNVESYILRTSKFMANYAVFLEENKQSSGYDGLIAFGVAVLAGYVTQDPAMGETVLQEYSVRKDERDASKNSFMNSMKQWELETEAIHEYMNRHYSNGRSWGMPTKTATEAPEPSSVDTTTSRAGDTRVSSKDGAVMVYVPAGEFQMGSTNAEFEAVVEQCVAAGSERDDCEGWYEDEQPVHTVALDAFWIDQTEVTNAQYTRCVDDGACEPSEYADDADFSGDDYPVVGVSWHDAVAYCTWAEKRLPTEAEWEYAARGPEGRIYPWGDAFDCARGNFDDETEFDDYVVPGGAGCDGYVRTAPVGSFPDGVSWAGALDMAGNVWEWVADWHGEYPSGRQENPTGPETGQDRGLRGGGWYDSAWHVRAADRNWISPAYRYFNVGFRCAIAARQGP